MISESFGRMLRRKRQAAGLSQRDLGQLVELDHTYLSKIENDRLSAPSFKAIRRLATVLCVDVEEMAEFAEPSKRYMARLDTLQEEIGGLHQIINRHTYEIAELRKALIILFNASDTYNRFVVTQSCGCVVRANEYTSVSTLLQQAREKARNALDLRPSGFVCSPSHQEGEQ